MRRSKSVKPIRFEHVPRNRYAHKHFADPGVCHIEAGDAVLFCGVNTAITVFLPRNPFVEGERRDFLFSLKKGEERSFVVQDRVRAGEEFPYAVYCVSGNDFAEGASPPRMIVGGGEK